MAAIVSTAATAVRVNAKAAGIKTTGSSRAAFLSRKAARSVAAVAATRKVATRAVVTETTAESSADSAELYKEFERLLVDYQFSYKVGDRVTGKVFHCDAKGAWVDIGAKAAALCPGSEASLAQARNVSTSHALPTLCFRVVGEARARAGTASRAFSERPRHRPAGGFTSRGRAMWIALREKRITRPETDRYRRFPIPRTQAAAVFDIGEEYEFEIIRDDDGDGSLTLSVRKIQVRVAPAIRRYRPTSSSNANDPKT